MNFGEYCLAVSGLKALYENKPTTLYYLRPNDPQEPKELSYSYETYGMHLLHNHERCPSLCSKLCPFLDAWHKLRALACIREVSWHFRKRSTCPSGRR